MGSLVLLGLSPGSPPHSCPVEPSILVALGSSEPGGVRSGMSRLHQGQGELPASLGAPSAAAGSPPSVVPHSGRLCHRTARIPGQVRDPDHRRPLLKVGALRGAPKTAVRQRDHSAPGPTCVQAPGGDVRQFANAF